MKDLNKKKEFIHLRAKDKSYEEIGKKIGVHKNTCYRWDKQFKEVIEKQRNINIREIVVNSLVSEHNKMKIYNNIVNRLISELNKRDFKELKIETLIKSFEIFSSKLEETGSQYDNIENNYVLNEQKIDKAIQVTFNEFNKESHIKSLELMYMKEIMDNGNENTEELKKIENSINMISKMNKLEWIELQKSEYKLSDKKITIMLKNGYRNMTMPKDVDPLTDSLLELNKLNW